jgi:4-aminobutyrate aminotransferase
MLTVDPGFGQMLGRVAMPVPGPRSVQMAADLAEFEIPTANAIGTGEMPVLLELAQGANMMDVDGNVYVDLTAAYTVAAAGHANPEIVAAMAEQAGRLMHTPGADHPSVPRVELHKRLAQVAPGNLTVSHIASTGAEAIEAAYKTARIYTKNPGFLAFEGGFHGKTAGALTLTSKNYYRQDFLPLVPEVYHYPYAYCYRCPYEREYPSCDLFCARYIEQRLDNPDSGLPRMAGLIFEPILGHGGWVVPPVEFVSELRRITRERDIVLVADEIITGFGRTGKWFACQHSDVVPDVLVVAKAMASGFPISAIMTSPEIACVWGSCQHTSTFMANPVGSAAALASIKYLQQHNLVERSAEIGVRMLDACQQMQTSYPIVGDARGRGSMVGLEIVADRKTKEPSKALAHQIRDECLKRGVVATNVGGMYGNVLKLAPPLVITDAQLDFALAMMDESIASVQKSL